jgi:hypothetical protein
MDGREWVGGAGWMPVRRDLIGYTYELEAWEGSSLSGVLLEDSSPSCMIESKGREKEKRRRSYSGERRGNQLAEADQEPIICLLTQQNELKYGDKNVSNQTLCGEVEVMSPQLPGRVMG